MSSFVYIFAFSYLSGLINTNFLKETQKSFLLGVLKGFITLALIKLYLNTGLALLVATIGLTLGHAWPVTKRFQEEDATPVLLGSYVVFCPTAAALALVSYIVINKCIKNSKTTIVSISFAIPVVFAILGKADSLVLTSAFGFFILLMQYLPYVRQLNNNNSNRWFLKRKVFLIALSVFCILSVVVLLFFTRYVYKGFGMQMDIIRNGPREHKFVALTFDDGPDPVYTPQVLDILHEKDVKATFFLVGTNAKRNPQIVERIFEEGHSIGNHTYSHRSLIPLSNKGIYQEIMKGEEVIWEITGKKPTLFRPPRGLYTQYARDLLKEQRYTIVLWDVSGRDWEEIRHNSIESYVFKHTQPGSILLLHDCGDIVTAFGGNRINTVRALPGIIDKLKAAGYEFLSVDEMIVLSGLSETEGLFE